MTDIPADRRSPMEHERDSDDTERLLRDLWITSSMTKMGEKIAWGSDVALMDQSADMIRAQSAIIAELRAEVAAANARTEEAWERAWEIRLELSTSAGQFRERAERAEAALMMAQTGFAPGRICVVNCGLPDDQCGCYRDMVRHAVSAGLIAPLSSSAVDASQTLKTDGNPPWPYAKVGPWRTYSGGIWDADGNMIEPPVEVFRPFAHQSAANPLASALRLPEVAELVRAAQAVAYQVSGERIRRLNDALARIGGAA